MGLFVSIPVVAGWFENCNFITYLDLRSRDDSSLFLLFKIVLAIWSLLSFRTSFSIFFCSCEKCHWNFDRECIESINHFGFFGHFNCVSSFNL
jgi:hypothetical protein